MVSIEFVKHLMGVPESVFYEGAEEVGFVKLTELRERDPTRDMDESEMSLVLEIANRMRYAGLLAHLGIDKSWLV